MDKLKNKRMFTMRESICVNKRYIVINFFIFLFSCILIRTVTVNAKEVTDRKELSYTIQGMGEGYTYTFDEFWVLYERYSNTYKRNIVSHDIEALKNTVASIYSGKADKEYLSINSIIEELKYKKQQLESYKEMLLEEPEDKDSADSNSENVVKEIDMQIASIDSQMSQYNASKEAAGSTVADTKLQENLSYFYKNNQNLLINDTKNRLKFNFLKRCFQFILAQEEIQYYKEYRNYLSVLQSVEEIKYKKGFSRKQELERANADLLNNEHKLEMVEKDFHLALETVQKEVYLKEGSGLTLSFSFWKKEFDMQKIIKAFLEQNVRYLQLKNTEQSYQTYLYSLGITNYALYQQVSLQIRECQLEQEELRLSIEEYVKKAINEYNLAFKEMEHAKEEQIITEQKHLSVEARIKQGRGTQLELYQSYMDRTSARITYYKSLYHILGWEAILTSSMYGMTF